MILNRTIHKHPVLVSEEHKMKYSEQLNCRGWDFPAHNHMNDKLNLRDPQSFEFDWDFPVQTTAYGIA